PGSARRRAAARAPADTRPPPAATRSPTVSPQAAWTAASRVFGAAWPSAARRAPAAGRGERLLLIAPCRLRSCRRRIVAGGRRHRHDGLPRRRRNRIGGSGGDRGRPAAGEALDQPLAAGGVELAHHVVEK